jgi:hypothetical protein
MPSERRVVVGLGSDSTSDRANIELATYLSAELAIYSVSGDAQRYSLSLTDYNYDYILLHNIDIYRTHTIWCRTIVAPCPSYPPDGCRAEYDSGPRQCSALQQDGYPFKR